MLARAGRFAVRTAALAASLDVAAQIHLPPPIQDHYAGATVLIAPAASPAVPPVAVSSEAEYVAAYGTHPPGTPDPARQAARMFFEHGGERLFVASPSTPDAPGFRTALSESCALAADLIVAAGVDCCADGEREHAELMNDLAAHASNTPGRFAVLHSPPGLDAAALLAFRATLNDAAAAGLYAPWLVVPDPDGGSSTLPAPAAVAGLVSRTDRARGLHVSPAGADAEVFAAALENDLSGAADALNVEGVNVLRAFGDPSRFYVWGARTLSPSAEFRFIAPTRLYRHLRHSTGRSLQWIRDRDSGTVDPVQVEHRLDGYLSGYWQAGSLAGATPDEAYFIDCAADPVALRCTVGVAPVRPAEFLVFVVDVAFRELVFRSDFAGRRCG